MEFGTTDIKEPGQYGIVIFSLKEIETTPCCKCEKTFKINDDVYACEHCKKVFHRTCVSSAFGLPNTIKFPCRHLNNPEYSYIRAKVVVE